MVWWQSLAILVRHPVATVAPALILGPLSEAPHLLSRDRSYFEDVVVFIVESLVFYLYVAYAERLTSEARSNSRPIPALMVLRNLALAAPVVPIVAFSSLAAIALPTAAASVLVIPGIWLMTRLSLFAPAIVSEHLGPVASLKRSNDLVKGNFELVFLTAALAVVLEEAFESAGTLTGLVLTGSETWGQWLGGSVGTIVILPAASFTTALVYGYLRRAEDRALVSPR